MLLNSHSEILMTLYCHAIAVSEWKETGEIAKVLWEYGYVI